MAEPTQSRVDLSGIHPLKRLTLIVLGFIFALSLTAAFAFQFVWFYLRLHTGWASCTTVVDTQGLLVKGGWPVRTGFIFRYISRRYSEHDVENIEYLRNDDAITALFALPGLEMKFVRHDVTKIYYFKIAMNHLWLIGLTAALYFFTRWRIRRSARIQNQPS